MVQWAPNRLFFPSHNIPINQVLKYSIMVKRDAITKGLKVGRAFFKKTEPQLKNPQNKDTPKTVITKGTSMIQKERTVFPIPDKISGYTDQNHQQV